MYRASSPHPAPTEALRSAADRSAGRRRRDLKAASRPPTDRPEATTARRNRIPTAQDRSRKRDGVAARWTERLHLPARWSARTEAAESGTGIPLPERRERQ